MSYCFICAGCIYRGQLSGNIVSFGVVVDDNFFLGDRYMGSFASLYAKCGFCSQSIHPEPISGHVDVHPKDQTQNIAMSINYHCHLHEPDCECTGCILKNRAKNEQDEPEYYEDDEDYWV